MCPWISVGEKAGSRLGTGTMIILDDKTCPVGMVDNLSTSSLRNPAAGAHPAAKGLPWTEVCAPSKTDEGGPKTLTSCSAHANSSGPGHTFCALAPGAMEPLQSALKHFRDDFENISVERMPVAP